MARPGSESWGRLSFNARERGTDARRQPWLGRGWCRPGSIEIGSFAGVKHDLASPRCDCHDAALDKDPEAGVAWARKKARSAHRNEPEGRADPGRIRPLRARPIKQQRPRFQGDLAS